MLTSGEREGMEERRTRTLNGEATGDCVWREPRVTEEAWGGMPLFALPPSLAPSLFSYSFVFLCGDGRRVGQPRVTVTGSPRLPRSTADGSVRAVVCACVPLKCRWRPGYTESVGSAAVGSAPPRCPLFPARRVCVCVCVKCGKTVSTNKY